MSKTMHDLAQEWHDERIKACVEACEGISDLRQVRYVRLMTKALEIIATPVKDIDSMSREQLLNLIEDYTAEAIKALNRPKGRL
jgi:hypothetical protein